MEPARNHASAPLIFNRARLRARRARAWRQGVPRGDAVAGFISERLADFSRSFPDALVIGPYASCAKPALAGKTERMTLLSPMRTGAPGEVVGDEEWLPFAAEQFDLILAPFCLHWVNDLPGTLVQVRRALKPDGMLLALVPGGETLFELRDALMQGSLAVEGGIRPYVSPFLDVRDGGMLLQRAGFALPVADSDRFSYAYPDMRSLLHTLRGLGETNALAEASHRTLPRAVLAAAEAHYAGEGGGVRATLEIVTLTGWKR